MKNVTKPAKSGTNRPAGVKMEEKLTTTERRGRREVEQPKVGPKGEMSGSERVKEHRGHGGANEVLPQMEVG